MPWKFGFPLNDHKDHSNQQKNNQKLCDEKKHPLWGWRKVNRDRDNKMVQISQKGESHSGKNTRIRKIKIKKWIT